MTDSVQGCFFFALTGPGFMTGQGFTINTRVTRVNRVIPNEIMVNQNPLTPQ